MPQRALTRADPTPECGLTHHVSFGRQVIDGSNIPSRTEGSSRRLENNHVHCRVPLPLLVQRLEGPHLRTRGSMVTTCRGK